MQTDFASWIISIFPIILLIMLLTVFHWTTTKAAAVTLAVAAATSVMYFKAGADLIGYEALKGSWNTATILFIIFPAILLYEIIAEAGCIDAINEGISKISPHQLFKILSVGWVFAGFLQGITGFGVPVAICVPILIGFGVKPIIAVVISLLGQSWGNTFGTLAVAWDVMVDISGISGDDVTKTALYTSILLWILNMAVGLTICWLYGRLEGIRQGFAFVAVVSLIHGGGELIVSQYNQSVAAFIPATAALAAVLLLSGFKIYKKEWEPKNSNIMSRQPETPKNRGGRDVKGMVAFSPYMVLVAVTVVLLIIPPVNRLLGRVSIGFAFPETGTDLGFINAAVDKYSPFYPLVDSGTVLLVTCIISFIILKRSRLLGEGALITVIKRAAIKTKPSAASILFLLIISKIMSGTGQTLIIAQGITEAMGDKYAYVAGFIGLIGAFITGSNMSSNILFTDVQTSAASNLGINSCPILAAQTAGAASGSVISPSKIVLGTTAAGEPGKEGEVLKKLLPLTVVIVIIIGVICRIVI